METRATHRRTKSGGIWICKDEAPAIGVNCMYMHSKQEEEGEEEKGMPVSALECSRTKTIVARVVPNKKRT